MKMIVEGSKDIFILRIEYFIIEENLSSDPDLEM